MTETAWERFVTSKRNAIVLDFNHIAVFSYGSPDHFEDKGFPRKTEGDEELILVGVTVYHCKNDGEVCGGYAAFAKELDPATEDPAQVWEVKSLDPLTLEPSLDCPKCPSHGSITDGKWVEA